MVPLIAELMVLAHCPLSRATRSNPHCHCLFELVCSGSRSGPSISALSLQSFWEVKQKKERTSALLWDIPRES